MWRPPRDKKFPSHHTWENKGRKLEYRSCWRRKFCNLLAMHNILIPNQVVKYDFKVKLFKIYNANINYKET